jgi:serine phosphatase RsbU (regulator of sigma subunit)
MRLRAQLALAFFLLAVLPLIGVTVYSYQASEHAFRRAVAAEAQSLAARMSTRVEAVAGELKERLQRMRREAPPGQQETPFQKARREELARAEKKELQLWLRSILSTAERGEGAIPFAIDADGRVYAPEPQDEKTLLSLGVVPGHPATRRDASEWVVPFRDDPETGVVIGVAQPVGPALSDFRRTAARNLALGLGLAVVAALGILPLSHRMTRHIASLTDASERLAAGDLSVRVKVPHGREFGRLAETFNRMARDLRANQERLIEQERLRKELEIGRRIQEELLPRAPLCAPFAEVSGVSVPAREVGGDFFNYFVVREGEVALLIGDVSGKGVGAALLMASLQATIRARVGLERDLACLVDVLDRETMSTQPLAPYFTLFLAVLEGRTGTLRWVNAGHNPQFVLRGGGGVERLASTGRPPGLYPGGGYEEQTLRFAEGDELFLFTDGLIEAEDEVDEPFGMARLEALLQVHRSEELPALLARVHAAVREHRGPTEAADDATMVALRFSGGVGAGAAS